MAGEFGAGKGKFWGGVIYILKAFLLEKGSTRDLTFFIPKHFSHGNNHLGENKSGISLPKKQ